MKRSFIYFAILACCISCRKSWLEVVPFGNQVSKTTNDFDMLMNNDQYYYFTAGGWGEAQLMGDEVAALEQFFGNYEIIRERLFQWQDSIFITPEKNSFNLTGNLRSMYSLNKIIEEVMASEGGSEQQKAGIRAEALATRAWTNFDLVNHYCKPYNPNTANNDPGFPIIKEVDVNVNDFPRGTVQQSYDFIIGDLKEALLAIPQKPAIVTRMSKPAVEGLLGKVYLFMGNYTEALPYLESAVANVIANAQTSLYNYNETFAPGGQFLPIDQISGPRGPGQIQNDLRESVVSKVWKSGRYSGNISGNDGLVLSQEAKALYGENDYRLLFYTDMDPDFNPNPDGRLRKYGVENSRNGLELSELYLLRAECRARLNNLSGAVEDVEFLRRHRIRTSDGSGNPIDDAEVPAAIAASQNDLIKFIIEERVREFAFEGYRWFDMRRLSLDPLFANVVYTHTWYDSDGSTTIFTLKQPERFVLRFPRSFTDAIPDLNNNP